VNLSRETVKESPAYTDEAMLRRKLMMQLKPREGIGAGFPLHYTPITFLRKNKLMP